MARQIFIVDALVVDQNGTCNHIDGYPKPFDSNNYQGDVDKAKRRAEGDMSKAWSDMCKIDTRQIQTVTLTTVNGFQLEKKSMGQFPAEDPEPEPAAAE
ncbi:MAG: hypothetical protein IKE24_09570 [Clostridia bacterium]|nr:hypothetical protein [Clostridia bacterium]